MNHAPRILLTFDSIHDVIRAEKILLAEGLYCDLVPTPRHISSDCGMSVECLADNLSRLEALRTGGRLDWRGVHSAANIMSTARK